MLREEKVNEDQLIEKLDQDEFLYDPETKGRMTLEQAEAGYSLIDPLKNKSGRSYIKVKEISHKDVVNRVYNSLQPFEKNKLNKKIIGEVLEICEEVTYPEMILNDKLLEKVYTKLLEKGVKLTKSDIEKIWYN